MLKVIFEVGGATLRSFPLQFLFENILYAETPTIHLASTLAVPIKITHSYTRVMSTTNGSPAGGDRAFIISAMHLEK